MRKVIKYSALLLTGLSISGASATLAPEQTVNASVSSTVHEKDQTGLAFFRGKNKSSVSTRRIKITHKKIHMIVRNSGISSSKNVTVKIFKSGKLYKTIKHTSKGWNSSGGFHTYKVSNGSYSARVYSAGSKHKVFGAISNSSF